MLPQSQPDVNSLTADEAKASLGIATFLQDQLMPKAMPPEPQAQETPNPAPQQEQTQEPQNDVTSAIGDLGKQFSEELQNLKLEIKKDIKGELTNIRKEIETVLNEPETDKT